MSISNLQSPISGNRTLILATLLAGLLTACGRPEASTPVPTTSEPAFSASEQHLRTFEALWQAVDEQFVYPDFGGVDWQATYNETLTLVTAARTDEAFAETMRHMLSVLPEGLARFETRAERIEAETADRTNYEGIGAFISFRSEPEPHVVLLAIIPDSPAEAAGLVAHDSIYAIDSQPVTAEEGLEVVHRIRGPADSVVILTIQTPGESQRDVTVQRAQVVTRDGIRGGVLSGTSVAYLRVPTLGDNALANNLAQFLQAAQPEEPLTGLILDLRIAHTGGGWPLAEMLTLFGDGEMGEFYTRTSTEPIEIEGQDIAGSQTLPLILLIGPDTRGFPEIFAAAMQATGRATLVGLPTDGDIEVPTEIPLPDGSRAFIAHASYRTPDGLDVGRTGLVPDVRVNADWDEVTTRTDQVLFTALEMLSK